MNEEKTGSIIPDSGTIDSGIQSRERMPDWMCRAAILMLFGIELSGL